MVVERVLKNGVIVHSLDVKADYREANEMLSLADCLQGVDARHAYSKRIANDFVATYETAINREHDYQRFINTMKKETMEHYLTIRGEKRNLIRRLYSRGLYESYEAWDKADDNIIFADSFDCPCSQCSMRMPTIEEWKTGKYNESEKRQIKLGKKLLKAGFPQKVIDFYSLQSKDEKRLFLTISDLPQHIVGMSNYAEIDEWDGYGGTSCQDSRHNDEHSIHLAGSLYDDKLFIGMLHYEHDDLLDMTDKLKARVLFRYLLVDGTPCLVPTLFYGNNNTKDELLKVIEKLGDIDIFNKDCRGGRETIQEEANGKYKLSMTDTIMVIETIDHDVEIECPLCNGSGKHEVYSDIIERWFNATCPSCNGNGSITTNVYLEIEETVEVESVKEILPYNECYTHRGTYILMDVDIDKIRETREYSRES